MHYPDTEGGADVPEPVRRAARTLGFKSALFAPMLWEEAGDRHDLGQNREFAGPFSDKEIALLRTFTNQAVIAPSRTPGSSTRRRKPWSRSEPRRARSSR